MIATRTARHHAARLSPQAVGRSWNWPAWSWLEPIRLPRRCWRKPERPNGQLAGHMSHAATRGRSTNFSPNTPWRPGDDCRMSDAAGLLCPLVYQSRPRPCRVRRLTRWRPAGIHPKGTPCPAADGHNLGVCSQRDYAGRKASTDTSVPCSQIIVMPNRAIKTV
jgi:hypothetical protein